MNDLLKKATGTELKKCRISAGKTLIEVSEDTKISKDLISRYENGESSMIMDKFCQLIEYYGLNLAIFFNQVYTNMYNYKIQNKEQEKEE